MVSKGILSKSNSGIISKTNVSRIFLSRITSKVIDNILVTGYPLLRVISKFLSYSGFLKPVF